MLYAIGEQMLLEINVYRGQHASWFAGNQLIAGMGQTQF
jgi:hypothetical protein